MLRFLTNAISRALGFSKVEARGTLLLIFVMLAGITFSKIYVHSLKNPTEVDSRHIDELKEWVAEVNSAYDVRVEKEAFDKSVYLPKKETFTKSNKIDHAEAEKETLSSPKEKTEKVIVISDLNTATAEELQKVKGIGPAFSKRIVSFREKLGGFASNDQLREVYNLEEETVEEVLKYFSVQSDPIQIDINSDSAKVLARHPYISYDLAWIIINYRKQHGNIEETDDLKNIKAIDEETIVRLKPYLD